MNEEICLVRVSKENWKKAVGLTTDPERKNPLDQQWVTSNAFSMLQAIYDPAWDCRLITVGDNAVGFVFYGHWVEKDRYLLCRFMIDERYQRRGYGKAALPLIVSQMQAQYGCKDIYLTVEDANLRAIKLYTEFGFERTEELDESERVYLFRGTNCDGTEA